MNGTTTRARTGRGVADQRRGVRPAHPQRDGRREPLHGVYLDGANALQIGYADPTEVAPPGLTQPIAPRRGSRVRSRSTTSPASLAPLPVSLPRAPFLAMVVALVVVGVLGVLVLNTKINENAIRLDDLQAGKAALDLQEQELAKELAERESPGNLRVAAKRLGLVPAGKPAFITLPDGRVVGVPQPAGGESNTTAPTSDQGR